MNSSDERGDLHVEMRQSATQGSLLLRQRRGCCIRIPRVALEFLEHAHVLLRRQHLEFRRLHERGQVARELLRLRRKAELPLLRLLEDLSHFVHLALVRHPLLVKDASHVVHLGRVLHPHGLHHLRVFRLALLHLHVELGQGLAVRLLHVRRLRRLLVDHRRVVRRVRGQLGVLLEERVSVRLDLLLQVALELLHLLGVLAVHLRRDCCDPVEAVARASRAEVARPDHSHLGTRVELSVNALHLRRVVARVLAELEKFFLDLLLGGQLDAQGELEEPRCLRVRLDARDHELHVVTQLGDHGLAALASVTKSAFDVENARLRRYVDVDRGLQLPRADQLLQLDLGAHRDTEQLEALRREHGVAVARVHDPAIIFFWSADSELRERRPHLVLKLVQVLSLLRGIVGRPPKHRDERVNHVGQSPGRQADGHRIRAVGHLVLVAVHAALVRHLELGLSAVLEQLRDLFHPVRACRPRLLLRRALHTQVNRVVDRELRCEDADAGGLGHDQHGDHVLQALLQEDQLFVPRQMNAFERLRGDLDNGCRVHLERLDLQALREYELAFDSLNQERRDLLRLHVGIASPRDHDVVLARVTLFACGWRRDVLALVGRLWRRLKQRLSRSGLVRVGGVLARCRDVHSGRNHFRSGVGISHVYWLGMDKVE